MNAAKESPDISRVLKKNSYNFFPHTPRKHLAISSTLSRIEIKGLTVLGVRRLQVCGRLGGWGALGSLWGGIRRLKEALVCSLSHHSRKGDINIPIGSSKHLPVCQSVISLFIHPFLHLSFFLLYLAPLS